ncbi:MAG: Holliday junction branch migration DNA helicase RuvB [Rickettsiales bacterium]|nr:MAG: Holliday junction branch migration DNA helicase RuvB [Rickettsiales bacterium]
MSIVKELDKDIIENTLRPVKLDDFVGQNNLKENLKVFIESAKIRNETLDHTLFYGPPGLGKTTLSQIIAHEMGVGFKGTSGPILSKAGDLAAILTNVQANDVLFIDEIHRLSTSVEEVLYSAMEDFKLDIIIGEGPSARTIKIDLPKFTLIGATTRLGLLSNPLRDRFGIPLKLNFYSSDELKQIITRDALLLNTKIDDDASFEIATRSRGTARIAIRLLKRVRDFAVVSHKEVIDLEIVMIALERLNIDKFGLDASDIKYLKFIIENYNGGPVGVDTLSAALNEERDSIEDTIEPFLIQQGFVNKTPRGRIVTQKATRHLGIDLKMKEDILL